MSGLIRICRPSIDNDSRTVTANVQVEGSARKYVLAGTRRITYSTPIHGVPLPIQMIPFVATYITVAWATDSVVQVDCIDDDFASALENVRDALRQFYPTVQWDGGLLATRTTTCSVGERTVVLFSGGIDSTASLIRDLPNAPLPLCQRSLENAHMEVRTFSWTSRVT